ncbi:YesL family protein [Vagococcus proximus]|uniref:YesL family protein n=1 Tax=Vagococcus proximus TaxID=2991417 RepID=UPI0023B84939|nr:DUF624 domain-containing protein [Vagococcus proximus]
MQGFVKHSYTVGEWILRFLEIQILWIVYVLKGVIAFGVFPATGTVFRIIYLFISEPEEEIDTRSVFKDYYKTNFWELNKLGYIMTALLLVLAIDLRISQAYIGSYFVHYFLLALLILVLGTFLYLFPIYSRYDLSTFSYIKQAFIYFFSNIFETIAILLGFGLLLIITTALPILMIFAGVPLFIIPTSWFVYQAMKKMERKREALEEE